MNRIRKKLSRVLRTAAIGIMLLTPALPVITLAQGIDDIDETIRQQRSTVQEDLRQAEAIARGETAIEDAKQSNSCSKFLGTCWYVSVPTIVVVIAILGVVVSKRRSNST